MKPMRSMTSTKFVLLGLVPYTKQNLLLSFSPNRFFSELEKISNIPSHDLKRAYKRAQATGYISHHNGLPMLSSEALLMVSTFAATKLSTGSQLMVAFDVPEDKARQRRLLRLALKKLEFEQAQRSVWISEYDHIEIVKIMVRDLGLQQFVRVYIVSSVVQ